MGLSELGIFIFSVLFTAASTGLVLKYLRKKAILDLPNERSSHSIPTPRGGGLGMLACLLPGLLILDGYVSPLPQGFLIPLIGMALLAGLSWIDDLKDLGPGIRFLSQILIVCVCTYFLPETETGYLGGFLPLWAEKIVLGVGWVWFINLFNFMDGIDGISGSEICALGLGILLITVLGDLLPGYSHMGLLFSGSAVGFLIWNWHRAKVFMGDVGSVPIGFFMGWILIMLAGQGYVIPVLLISLYYLADATTTLIRRALRKEKVWQAHREHFYQLANKAGYSHSWIVLHLIGLNAFLLFCTWFALQHSIWIACFLAIIAVSGCLFFFQKIYSHSQAKS